MSSGAGPDGQLADGVRAGDARALARAISVVEAGGREAAELLAALAGGGGDPYTVGVTGPPGAGKSTLIAELVREARVRDLTIGVLAVDPSSPFGGGALLGDRIRLGEHYLDPGVFIRSSGSRGHAGGLAAATGATVRLMGAAGKKVVFVETVGSGQGEVAVRAVADTVVLVLMPGGGDSVQALKAGVMEIPDLVVFNKSDLPGAAAAASDLRRAIALGPGQPPEVLLTDARSRAGTAELWQRIERRRTDDAAGGVLAQRRAALRVAEAIAIASAGARRYLENAVTGDPDLGAMLDSVGSGTIDPVAAARAILAKVLQIGDDDDPDTG